MMSGKPKILIIENSVDVTGALKAILLMTSDLQENFEIQFAIPENSKGRSLIESQGFNHVYEFPMKELSKNPSAIIRYVPYLLLNAYRLSRFVKKNRISLIHVNDIYNLLPAVINLLGKKTPYVCHIRFMPDRFPQWLFNFWFKVHLRYSNQIIAVSKSVSRQLPRCEKIVTIYDGLPKTERYDEQTQNQGKDDHTFLYLANFIEGKGQNFAIEAFAKIHQKLPNWKLRLVGGDLGLNKNMRYRGLLEEKAKALGIYDKTEWVGFTNDVEAEYKQAGIVLNFSQSESFSMTCLETLFFGRPLIATNCGGPSEILEGGQIGVLVPMGDIRAMANAMEKLGKDPDERSSIGRRARSVVRQKFSKENTSMQLAALYKKILNQ